MLIANVGLKSGDKMLLTPASESMQFRAEYDIPLGLIEEPHSRAFHQFLRYWFIDSRALTSGEVDISFLKNLTVAEAKAAKELLRRNLNLKYSHIIDGSAALGDSDAVPILRSMLAAEKDPSWRLTIAGALWKLTREDSFVRILQQVMVNKDATVKQAHFDQILWLQDDRTVDMLIDVLDDKDEFVRHLALLRLNSLEFGKWFVGVASSELPRNSTYYKKHRNDLKLRQIMVSNIPAPRPFT